MNLGLGARHDTPQVCESRAFLYEKTRNSYCAAWTQLLFFGGDEAGWERGARCSIRSLLRVLPSLPPPPPGLFC